MENPVLQLYPPPAQEHALHGLYLGHNLRRFSKANKPYVYGNFVASLDGRIAIPSPDGEGLMIPKNVSNERDWRLYQELAAQADVILSSGRYLRDWAAGRAQEILKVDDPQFADLREWRAKQGLPAHPDLAIISNSLDFPLPDVLTANGRKVIFLTTGKPNPERVREIESKVGRVFVAGENSVEGKRLFETLAEQGYRIVYSAAGPKVAHLLLADGVLNRLYLTSANRLLGGDPFASTVDGPLLEPAAEFKLNTLYFDPHGVDGLGQVFASYNSVALPDYRSTPSRG